MDCFHEHLLLNELLNHHLNLSCNHNFSSNRTLSNSSRSFNYHNHNSNCNHSFNFSRNFDHNSNHNSSHSFNHNSNRNFDHTAGRINLLNITLISHNSVVDHLIFLLLSYLKLVAVLFHLCFLLGFKQILFPLQLTIFCI